jgi:hypothetical protein
LIKINFKLFLDFEKSLEKKKKKYILDLKKKKIFIIAQKRTINRTIGRKKESQE